MRRFFLAGLVTLSTSAFADDLVRKITGILPFGVYEGEDCVVFVSEAFSGHGLSLSLNRNGGGINYSVYNDSPWTKVLKDKSTELSVDLKVKRNTGMIQRLMIKDGVVTIQEFERSKVKYETSCNIME